MEKPFGIEDRYLGDGVYASYDGYHIWLDLRAQNPSIRIALEQPVFEQLVEYQKHIVRELQRHNESSG